VWTAGIAALAGDTLVLSARPAAAEEELSFAGLADLLAPVGADALAVLPTPQRRALEVALLRAQPEDGPAGSRALAAALLGARRAPAAAGTVLVAVDDLQWLDRASAQALAFAARRLEHDAVRFLLARRDGEESIVEQAFAHDDLPLLELAPLSFGALQ